MQLVRDPCRGPLVRSVGHVHPGAVTERLRTTFSAGTTVSSIGVASSLNLQSSGYVVWFPSYHNDGTSASQSGGTAGQTTVLTPANMFVFSSNTPNAGPSNSASTGGAGTASSSVPLSGLETTGQFIEDPAFLQLGATSPFVRATTLSACLQLDYLSTYTALAGQVCTVQNYSLASFIQNINDPGAVPMFPSVDQIFAHAAERQRLQPEGVEVIWRPSDSSSIPRVSANSLAGTTQKGMVLDAPFWLGNFAAGANQDYTRVCASQPNEVFGICIAWRNLPSGGASINAVKVVDLELAARNGQIEELRTGEPPKLPSTTIDTVVNALDSMSPGWQSSLRKVVTDGAKRVGMTAMNYGMSTLMASVYGGGVPYQAIGAIAGASRLALTNR